MEKYNLGDIVVGWNFKENINQSLRGKTISRVDGKCRWMNHPDCQGFNCRGKISFLSVPNYEVCGYRAGIKTYKTAQGKQPLPIKKIKRSSVVRGLL